MEGDVWQIGMVSWFRYGEEQYNLVRDWHLMPHRKRHLLEDAVRLFLTHESTREAFSQSREHWQALQEEGEEANTLSLLRIRARIKPALTQIGKLKDSSTNRISIPTEPTD
jgi:hypothetical protein